jgi:hypothetical protein
MRWPPGETNPAAARAAALAASVVVAACGPDAIDLPEPPLQEETAAITAEYDAPSGTLDRDRLRQMAGDVRERLDELQLRWLPRLVSTALTRLQRRFEEAGLPGDPTAPRDTNRANIKAVVNLDSVCSGWSDPPGPPNREENGSMKVTALVVDSQLQGNLWGSAFECRSRVEPLPSILPGDAPLVPATAEVAPPEATPNVADPGLDILLDGTLLVHLYGPLPQSLIDADFLTRFVGQVTVGDRTVELDVDLRWIDRQLEFRQPVEDGNVIVASGLTRFTLRGQNLTVTCDATTLACQ